MSKKEITEEERSFKLDPFTLARQLEFWIVKSNCFWTLKQSLKKYESYRETDMGHPEAFEKLKKEIFKEGKNNL